jgi:hypothetical protein
VLDEYNSPVENVDQQHVGDLTFATGQTRTLSVVSRSPPDLPPGC